MIANALLRLSRRYRPQEGWLSLILLFMLVGVLGTAVLEVNWIPEAQVIVPALILGLLLGAVLARRPVPAPFAWLLIILYGLLIVLLTLAHLWPPPALLLSDWPALRLYWLENGSEFVERTLGWSTAVFAGGRSNETLVFALIIGLAAWFLAAYLGWSAYRLRRPLLGLTLMGLVIALNGYYGRASIEWTAVFIGLAVLTTAVFHVARLRHDWERDGVDYTDQIQLDLLIYATGVGLSLLALSFLLPTVRVQAAGRLLLGNERVAALEETLERAFGGVEIAREREPSPGMPGGRGILPRAFLLGNPPQLEQVVMMTATAEVLAGPPGASPQWVRHWRGLSYSEYTGRGWSLAEESAVRYAPQEALPAPPMAETMTLRQEVHWRYDRRRTRYALGRPLRLDHAVTAYWLDPTDLVRVQGGDEIVYAVETLAPLATADELRRSAAEALPPAIQFRYTRLPDSVPERVTALAQEVAGELPTPYDQALALERFLRQYPYSLDVTLPPAGVDLVDYFLFDLQRGYCDYYASAMVVMARSLGLPARLVTGYLAQTPDEEGVQTIRQINSHAWVEIYFPGYGWIPFEPTAPFASSEELFGELGGGSFALPQQEQALTQPPEIPEAEPADAPLAPPIAAGLGIAVGILLAILWRRRRRAWRDGVQAAYGRLDRQLQALDPPPIKGETPFDRQDRLQARLDQDGTGAAQRIGEPARELTAVFVEHQYAQNPPQKDLRAAQLWQRLRWPLWRLRLQKLLRRD